MYSGTKTLSLGCVILISLVFLFTDNSLHAQTTKEKVAAPAATEIPKQNRLEREVQACKKLFSKYGRPLQDLWQARDPSVRAENTDGFAFIEDMSLEHCESPEQRKELIKLLARILNTHSGKIGIILPISSFGFLRHIMFGIEENLKSHQLSLEKNVIVIDTKNDPVKLRQGMASLIFEHKVSTILGGTEPNEAEVLRDYASKFLIPTFLMIDAPQASSPPPSPHTFYAHPTYRSLAITATAANMRFGHKRISILSPLDQHSDRFINAYLTSAKESGISIISQIPYDSKRFDTMEAAARKMFRLDNTDRQDELAQLYQTAKKHAQETGQKFNPSMIALQPDITQDAVLIPDNFKIVRHFAKIFSYLGVRKMFIFGNFEWRSKGLISPWDNLLHGSYFVDFQGPYTSLPGPLKVIKMDNPNLATPDQVEQADYSLVGWRAVEWPIKLSVAKSEARRKLNKLVVHSKDRSNTLTFDEGNILNWPSTAFSVNGNGSSTGVISVLSQ